MNNPMNSFLGLLAAVVGLMILITLSIMELWATPWPILLILLLVILWTSQRLIDRFNPAPVEGLGSLPNSDPSNPRNVPQDFSPEHPDSALRYRGQVYEESSDPIPEAILQTAKPTCYRGIRMEAGETLDSASSSETPTKAQPSEAPPKLSYRGIKRS